MTTTMKPIPLSALACEAALEAAIEAVDRDLYRLIDSGRPLPDPAVAAQAVREGVARALELSVQLAPDNFHPEEVARRKADKIYAGMPTPTPIAGGTFRCRFWVETSRGQAYREIALPFPPFIGLSLSIGDLGLDNEGVNPTVDGAIWSIAGNLFNCFIDKPLDYADLRSAHPDWIDEKTGRPIVDLYNEGHYSKRMVRGGT